MEKITMTSKELDRINVINNLIKKNINGTQAANQLRLSIRQVKRLKRRVLKHGPPGIIHRGRGRPSNRRIDQRIEQKVKKLLSQNYADFKPKFAGEKLAENHHIQLSSEKVRQIMISEGLWQSRKKRKNSEHRQWRPRKEYFGQMIQFDGSYHSWLEDRAEKACLLLACDDATGKIVSAKFAVNESVKSVFEFWKNYVSDMGKPVSIYLDRHSTYRTTRKKNFVIDTANLTQFERVMKDLDIELIHALSPQGKGRVERMFDTLQDRLIKELRLAKINNYQQANQFLKEYLPKFNQKFAVLATKKGDLHRQLTKADQINLDKIFSRQETRIINNDFTISFKNQWLQLTKNQPTIIERKDKVLVEERLDNSIHISLRGKYMNYQILPAKPRKIKKQARLQIDGRTKSHKPSTDHPWRQYPNIDKKRPRYDISTLLRV